MFKRKKKILYFPYKQKTDIIDHNNNHNINKLDSF